MEALKKTLYNDISEAKPTLKKASIDNYIASFGKFHRLKKDRQMKHYYMRPATIVKEIYKMKGVSNNTRKNYLSAIMNVLTCYKYPIYEDNEGKTIYEKLTTGKRRENAISKYRGAIYDLRLKIDEEKAKLKDGLTDRERENMISYEQVQAGFNLYNNMAKEAGLDKAERGTKLTGAEFDLLQRWVLTALYSFLPPARNEYATLLCGIRDKEGIIRGVPNPVGQVNRLKDGRKEHYIYELPRSVNYLIRDEWSPTNNINEHCIHLIINQHKSNKSLGSRHFTIFSTGKVMLELGNKSEEILGEDVFESAGKCKTLYQVLHKWYELSYANWVYQPLFVNKKGGRMNRNSLTKYLITTYQKLYPNKKISTNILRKAFHSSKDAEFKKQYDKKKVVAESMGHSIGEAMATYTKHIPK